MIGQSPWVAGCLAVALLAPSTASAHGYSAPHRSQPYNPNPGAVGNNTRPDTSTLQSGSQYYRVGVRGLELHMADVQTQDPKAYETLQPDLRKLKIRRNVGWGLVAAGLAAGSVLLLGSFTFLGRKSTDEFGVTTTRTNNAALAAGSVMFGVAIAGAIVVPWRGAILKFVNRHNSVRPGAPLKYNPR